ncbi:DUF1365 domain-containing protein [Gallaecimonas mangrovi]|uniref:DUF1365 domain-containing protein n=1 Tax=Gallaecimonas mangrovi TaxID=2291597 RepID=UPI000E2013C4|nr:DUF1365 domain-containing protein [Gallaecimonas mangrovi]
MTSALYVGHVRHRRHLPKSHRFSYPFFMWYLDLDEMPADQGRWFSSTRFALARFYRPDYLGDSRESLSASARRQWREQLGTAPSGKVFGLLNLRTLGLYFSPVNFYYGFDEAGNWTHFLAEVSNTPWNERHCYCFNVVDGEVAAHQKNFHVSPFNPIEQQYRWRLIAPGKQLLVHLENHDGRGHVFDATLALERKALERKTVRRQLLAKPVMTATVVLGIYWQALKLALKGVKFYSYSKDSK